MIWFAHQIRCFSVFLFFYFFGNRSRDPAAGLLPTSDPPGEVPSPHRVIGPPAPPRLCPQKSGLRGPLQRQVPLLQPHSNPRYSTAHKTSISSTPFRPQVQYSPQNFHSHPKYCTVDLSTFLMYTFVCFSIQCRLPHGWERVYWGPHGEW